MTDSLRIAVSPGERRVALLRDGRLHLAAIERPARPDGVGDLHRGRVTAIARPMSGAFLLLGDGSTGFLPDSEAPDRRAVQDGAILPVRVTRAAQGGKGPRVTARLAEPERAAAAGGGVALVRRGPDAALRFAAAARAAMVVVDDAAEAARLRASLGADRVRLDRAGAFDDALEAEFEALAGPEVPLPGGGRLLVQPVAALTAIDVDAGSGAGQGDAGATLRLNEAAVAEAARQIRLRNLAGAILLDVAGLTAKRREALAAPLAAALAADPLRPELLGLTRLGLFEIRRSRVHPPLHEVIGAPPSPLTHGLAALRRAAREAAAMPGRPLALRAAPVVLAAVEALDGALEAFRAGAGRALSLRPDPALPPGRESIEDAA
ncbi:ribonuclease E/G [Falsiroseomonas sp. CW058]|uniref:ribonuclease E/G n=1 Tax=Falsiroseomonas sp. CW058 TaxID=3388664 RepID=UPI003D311B42